jgi:hypothetical protein
MTEGLQSLFEARPRRRGLRLNELHVSGMAVVAITVFYLAVVGLMGVPAAGEFFGHSLGVMGFGLMLATETLYTLRKRSLRRSWGRMSDWLRFHIFTGIVGPYLVLLHSAWSFNGLAGLVLLLTALVVASGFFGRYIYTAVPRTADGVMVEEAELKAQITRADTQFKRHASETRNIRLPADSPSGSGLRPLLTRAIADVAYDIRRAWARRHLAPALKLQAAELDALVRRRRELQRQIRFMQTARRMLALWHTVHIPIGIALFIMAFFHIGAAIYYATLLK